MTRAAFLLASCLLFPLLIADDVDAGDWVTYLDETAERLIVDAPFGVDDSEEKDYAWGDVDMDGDVDLVCVRKQPWNTPGRRRNVLFMNEGIAEGHAVNGVLVDRSVEYASATNDGTMGFLDLTNDRDVVLIDVDDDGWLDIVTATTYGTGLAKTISHPRVYRNLGTDTNGDWLGFLYEEERTPEMPIPPNFCGIGFGDISGDDSPDLYFVEYLNTLEDRLWINDGTGFFSDESEARMTFEMRESEFGVHAVIADMNGDGVRDVVKDRALVAPIRISVSYNDPGDEGFFDEFETVYLGSSYHVDVGDLNADGLLDIIIDDDGIDRYLLNQGNGADGLANFSEQVFPPESDSFGGNIVVRDLNKDGHQDVVIADVDVDCCGCNRHMHFWRNQGDYPNVTFVEETGGIPVSARTGTHDVAIFDINGDTWLDMVIGTCTGTSVWIADPPVGLTFGYPEGRPSSVPANQTSELSVDVIPIGGATVIPAQAKMHTSVNGSPFVEQVLVPEGGVAYHGVFPAVDCGDEVRYYLTAEIAEGGSFTDPPNGASAPFVTTAAAGSAVVIDESFDAGAPGWETTQDASLTGGAWQLAAPIGTLWNGEPAAPDGDSSAGGGGQAFVTGNGVIGAPPTANDVDGGPTTLLSPVVALDGVDATISYRAWFFTDLGEADALVVEITDDGGQSWNLVETIDVATGGWQPSTFAVSDVASFAGAVQLRFTVADEPNNSITEAGVDDFRVERLVCESFSRGDCNDDGAFSLPDPLLLLDYLFGSATSVPCDDACDVSDDGELALDDAIGGLAALFTGGPPPAPPFPGCGADGTDDDLGCDTYTSCP